MRPLRESQPGPGPVSGPGRKRLAVGPWLRGEPEGPAGRTAQLGWARGDGKAQPTGLIQMMHKAQSGILPGGKGG